MKRATITIALALAALPGVAHASDSYAGVFAGYAMSKPDYQEPSFPDYARNPSMNGANAGVYVGHDFVTSGIHAGVEADFGHLDNSAPNDPAAAFNDYTAFKAKWNAHARVRVGVPVGASTKLFAAGGAAFMKLDTDDVDPGWGHFERTYTGWTLGGGVEHTVASKLALRLEYLHDEYGSRSGNVDDSGVPGYDVRVAPSSDIVRVGLALKF